VTICEEGEEEDMKLAIVNTHGGRVRKNCFAATLKLKWPYFG